MAFEVGKPIVLEGRKQGKYIGTEEAAYYGSSRILETNVRKNINTLTVDGQKQAEILKGFIELKRSVIDMIAQFNKKIKGITTAAKNKELTAEEKEKLRGVLAEAEAYINETLGPLVGEALPKIAESLEPCIIAGAEGNSIARAHQTELAKQQVLEMRQRIGDFLITFANESLRVGSKNPKVNDRLKSDGGKYPVAYLIADNDRMIDVLEHEVNNERIYHENDIAHNNEVLRELNRELATYQSSREVYELCLRDSKSPEERAENEADLYKVVGKIADVSAKIQVTEISNENSVECINRANKKFQEKVEQWKAQKGKKATATETVEEQQSQPS